MQNRTRLLTALIFTLLAIGVILVLVFADLEDPEVLDEEAYSFPDVTESVFGDFSLSEVVTVSVIEEASGKEWVVTREFDDEGNPGEWSLEASPDGDLDHVLDAEQVDSALLALIGLSPTRTFPDVAELGEFSLAEDEALLITLSDGESTFELRVGGMNVDATDYYSVTPGEDDVMLLPAYQMEPLVTFIEAPPYLDDLIDAMDSEG